MLRYMHLQKECRSKYISAYFGDPAVKECGICDVCLHKKGSELTEEEFNRIKQRIFDHINGSEIFVKDLLQHLHTVKKEKIWKVLDFLQAENKIKINEFGLVKLFT